MSDNIVAALVILGVFGMVAIAAAVVTAAGSLADAWAIVTGEEQKTERHTAWSDLLAGIFGSATAAVG